VRFADVIGHDRVIERLQRATASGRLPHTYLFSGPEGVGKYTTACALAARLLCDAPGDDSCGSCAGCAAAVRETHPDFVVVRRMDGAAEVKIDQVRELQRRIRLRPVHVQRKIVILDDAHRLNLSAQNALLKTFEEPPGSVLLILVASNAAALLPTVLSRCQRINFFPLPDDVVEALLVKHGDISADAARDLARYADGSIGQGLLLKTDLIDRARTQLLPVLQDLEKRPYADLVEVTQEWARIPAADLQLMLRAPLAWYRGRLADALTAAPTGREARAALAQLRTVYDTMERLRRNAHRQLALDVMLLDLQAASEGAVRDGERRQ
jgi:DNA polymerase-3 subunit delta'